MIATSPSRAACKQYENRFKLHGEFENLINTSYLCYELDIRENIASDITLPATGPLRGILSWRTKSTSVIR